MKYILPEKISAEKKKELNSIVKHVLAEKKFLIMQIVLYGSYATENFVEYDEQKQPDGITTVYQSDFDILVVVAKNKHIKRKIFQYNISNRIQKDASISTPVQIIYESQTEVVKKLNKRRSFFVDIYTKGISLFSRKKFSIGIDLSEALSAKEQLQLSRNYQEEYMDRVEGRIEGFCFYSQKDNKTFRNLSAFELHQITENLLSCILLVFIHYAPKEHNLEILLEQWVYKEMSKSIAQEIHQIFPRNTPEEKHLFRILVKAYVDSRYDKNFSITKQELETLFQKIQKLKTVVKKASQQKIDECRKKLKQ